MPRIKLLSFALTALFILPPPLVLAATTADDDPTPVGRFPVPDGPAVSVEGQWQLLLDPGPAPPSVA